jgi:Protein of unknown function (DUF3159)
MRLSLTRESCGPEVRAYTVEVAPSGSGGLVLSESIAVGAVVRRVGPRLVRDGFGPLVVFYLGWKLIGLTAGIVLALVFGLSVFVHERRRGRPAAFVRMSLFLVVLRAAVGLSSGSARVYLAQEIGVDILLSVLLCGSLAVRRPLAAWLAGDVFPFTPEMRASETFQEVMRTVTAVWGCYFLARALIRFAALLLLSTDRFVVVVALSDIPFVLALLAWSGYHSADAFRRSPQWGPLIAAAEAAAPLDAPA